MRPFRVVTHRSWLAELFKPYGAVQDYGFDIDPETAESTIWWAPGAWVACAWASGIRLPLTLCGHRWMETLPWEYVQRGISVTKVQNVHDDPDADPDRRVHVKLPEAKLDSFPATVFPVKHLASTLRQFHVPADTLLQLSDVVNFTKECRFWIADGDIRAHSWYLLDGLTSDHDDFPRGPLIENTLLNRMANMVETLLADPSVDCPPGFTLDMGLTDDDRILVIEANAAWSSSPYDGERRGIFESILASHDFDNQHLRWRWRPNPVYGTVQPLKWAKPVRTANG